MSEVGDHIEKVVNVEKVEFGGKFRPKQVLLASFFGDTSTGEIILGGGVAKPEDVTLDENGNNAETGPNDELYAFNTVSQKWRPLFNVPRKKTGSMICVRKIGEEKRLFTFAGMTRDDKTCNELFIYYYSMNKWERVEPPKDLQKSQMVLPLAFFTDTNLRVINCDDDPIDYVVFFGWEHTSDEKHSDPMIFCFDLDRNSWALDHSLPKLEHNEGTYSVACGLGGIGSAVLGQKLYSCIREYSKYNDVVYDFCVMYVELQKPSSSKSQEKRWKTLKLLTEVPESLKSCKMFDMKPYRDTHLLFYITAEFMSCENADIERKRNGPMNQTEMHLLNVTTGIWKSFLLRSDEISVIRRHTMATIVYGNYFYVYGGVYNGEKESESDPRLFVDMFRVDITSLCEDDFSRMDVRERVLFLKEYFCDGNEEEEEEEEGRNIVRKVKMDNVEIRVFTIFVL